MTARRPRCLVLLILVLGTGGLAVAQQPQPSRDSDVWIRKPLGPEDVHRVGDWLRAMNGSNLPPEILEKIRDYLKNNRPTPQQLQNFAEKLRREYPRQLEDPKQNEAMRTFLQNAAGTSGLGGLPKFPEMGSGGSDAKQPDRGKPPPADLKLPKQPPDAPKSDGPSGVAASVGGDQGTPPTPPAGPSGSVASADGSPAGGAGAPDPQGSQATSADRARQIQAVTGWWEKNIGPLDETPAVRQLLVELVTGQGGSGDGGLAGLFDGRNESGELSGLGKAAESLGVADWKFPEFGLGKMDVGPPSVGGSMPSAPTGPSVGELGGVGGDSWLPVILLGIVAAAALVLWWVWPRLRGERAETPRPLPGLGPWPVDPRTIADREALVKAFEYLSVLQCGAGARTWNHLAIAAGLRQAVPTSGGVADPLAELYAVARYTPADEPFPDSFIADARHYLCRLAGVKPA